MIEFLYFEGCASYKQALDRLQTILAEKKIESPVEMIVVESDAMAEALKFPGSPTIRINGRDVHPDSVLEKGFSQKCRVYNDNGILNGFPHGRWIERAVDREKSG